MNFQEMLMVAKRRKINALMTMNMLPMMACRTSVHANMVSIIFFKK
jgi:hypothetical protein